MNLQEDIRRIKEVMGLLTEEEQKYDAILVGGLDYRSSDFPIDKQVQMLKGGFGKDKNVKGFRYNVSDTDLLDFVKANPMIPIFLFSAGCDKALVLSNQPEVDKNNLFIIEPYAASPKTKKIVEDAVGNGVPASNVFVGDSAGRGLGVVQGASKSMSSSHWGALEKIGGMKSGISVNPDTKTTSTNDKTIKTDTKEISYEFNPEIETLQKELVAKGYYIGKFGKNKDGVDGKYGPFTKAAHEAYLKGMNPEDFKEKRADMAQEYIGEVNDSTLTNEFNFHPIPIGSNNYRSAQIPVTLKGKDFLGQVIDKYGIKTIIRFNGDGGDSRHVSSHPLTSIEDEKNLAQSKGVNFYKLSSTKDQDKVNSLLSQGNVLIHCAHGADRTGGNVGGWLYENGWGDTQKIWDYTTKYNGWNRMVKNSPEKFVSGGYLKQAQKFGVKDLEHAKSLAGVK